MSHLLSSRLYCTVAACGILFLPASAMLAQEESATSLSIHGYLTQAYGMSSGDTIMGLTREGTFDYRRAAILVRFGMTSKDFMVVQVAHRRLGGSPTMAFEEPIKVDMAFYERRFHNGASVRVGKTSLPMGIYNDIRYVGTLLPFYRAPFSIYNEGSRVSETIDGVVARKEFRSGEAWQFTSEV
jgi:hypothetical protein